MDVGVVGAVVGRETREVAGNRLLLLSILVPPIALTVLPLLSGKLLAGTALPAGFAGQLLGQRPDWGTLAPDQLSVAFTAQQFLVFFLLMPAYIPLSIATFSIIGEKQSRSLEAVLATPIRTSELLLGKAIAALTPGVLAGWLTYLLFLGLAILLYGSWLGRVVSDPSWLAGTFLLGPAVGFVSVVAGILVSSRVTDPRTGQQIAGFIMVPLIAVIIVQATGTILLGASGYVALAVLMLVVGLILLRLGIGLFARESILTRWR
jgi:ABC-2 type transport system permease protein